MDCNGWLKCHLKNGIYNKTRLWLGYFNLIELDYKKSPTLISRYLGTSLGYLIHIDISILQYTYFFSTSNWGGGNKVQRHILRPWYPSRIGRWQGSSMLGVTNVKPRRQRSWWHFISLYLYPCSMHYFDYLKVQSISLLPCYLFIY